MVRVAALRGTQPSRGGEPDRDLWCHSRPLSCAPVEPLYSEITVNMLASASGEDPFGEAVADYVHNLLIGTQLRKLDKLALAELEDIKLIRQLAAEMLRGQRYAHLTTARVRTGLKRLILGSVARLRLPRPLNSQCAENLTWLSDTLGFDETESAILQMVTVVQGSPVEEVLDVFGRML